MWDPHGCGSFGERRRLVVCSMAAHSYALRVHYHGGIGPAVILGIAAGAVRSL